MKLLLGDHKHGVARFDDGKLANKSDDTVGGCPVGFNGFAVEVDRASQFLPFGHGLKQLDAGNEEAFPLAEEAGFDVAVAVKTYFDRGWRGGLTGEDPQMTHEVGDAVAKNVEVIGVDTTGAAGFGVEPRDAAVVRERDGASGGDGRMTPDDGRPEALGGGAAS